MTEKENSILYIAEECRKAGLTLAGTAGVVANIEAESAFRSDNLQDSYQARLGMDDTTYTARVDNGTYLNFTNDAAGYGLAQWTAQDRKAKMLAFHRARGKSIGDFETQVAFLLAEMQGYSRAWQTCMTSNNPHECGYAVCKYYEIPADTENQANHRGNRAGEWYYWIANHYQMPETPKQETTAKVTLRTTDIGIEGWPEVWLIQALLKTHGYAVLHDGIFGKSLEEKVKEFQLKNQLSADGIVGPKTWSALGMKVNTKGELT